MPRALHALRSEAVVIKRRKIKVRFHFLNKLQWHSACVNKIAVDRHNGDAEILSIVLDMLYEGPKHTMIFLFENIVYSSHTKLRETS